MYRYQSFSFILFKNYWVFKYITDNLPKLHTIMNVPAKLDNHNVHGDTVLDWHTEFKFNSRRPR